MKSRKQRTIQALQMLGCVEQVGVSRKYRVFDTRNQRFLIGKSGALRVCRGHKRIADSISLTDTLAHERLATLGEFPADISNPREVYANICTA